MQQVQTDPLLYESALVEEARAIVAGRSRRKPSVEHLRILLVWLDHYETEPEPAKEWNGQGAPF